MTTTFCPWCGMPSSVDRDYREESPIGPPPAGSVLLCWFCFKLGIIADNGEARKPTRREALRVARDPLVREWAALTAGAAPGDPDTCRILLERFGKAGRS